MGIQGVGYARQTDHKQGQVLVKAMNSPLNLPPGRGWRASEVKKASLKRRPGNSNRKMKQL